MAQLFSNNIDTTLGDVLSDVATSATLTSGAGLSTPTGGDYELLTLVDIAGNMEIVRMTARSGNTVTITRAQESTTARTWPSGSRVFAGVTAATLSAMVVNRSGATGGIAVGNGAHAGSASSIGIGASSYVEGIGGVSIGAEGGGSEPGHVGLGYRAIPGGAGAIAIGSESFTAGTDGEIAIGRDAWAGESEAIAIGPDANVDYARAGGIAIGSGVSVATNRTLHIGALPAVPKSNSFTGANAAWRMASPAAIIMSEPMDLKTLQTHTITVPTGVTFFPEEVGIIITAASGVTGQPTLRFGITGTEAKFLAATATTGLDAAHERERFTALASSDGAKTLRSEVTVAATGTTLTGRVYWRGFAVVDS